MRVLTIFLEVGGAVKALKAMKAVKALKAIKAMKEKWEVGVRKASWASRVCTLIATCIIIRQNITIKNVFK